LTGETIAATIGDGNKRMEMYLTMKKAGGRTTGFCLIQV